MSALREAVQQALEALESCSGVPHWPALQPTITALREALTEEALQRLTDANQEIEAVLGQPELKPVFYAPRRLSNEEVAAVIGLRRHKPEQELVTKSTWQKLYEAAIDQRNEAVALNQELLEALKYHQEQTRPIERTCAAIAKAEGQA